MQFEKTRFHIAQTLHWNTFVNIVYRAWKTSWYLCISMLITLISILSKNNKAQHRLKNVDIHWEERLKTKHTKKTKEILRQCYKGLT